MHPVVSIQIGTLWHGMDPLHCFTYTKKVKVKWSRYRPGVSQRVGRGIALLFHDRGTRRGWVVSSTPRPHFTPRERPGAHFTGGWVGSQARSGRAENLVPTGIRSRTVQPVVSLYTDWATRPTHILQELRKEKHCVCTYCSCHFGCVSAGVYCSEIASQLCAQEVRRSIVINITNKKKTSLTKVFEITGIHIDDLTKNFEHKRLSTEHQHWNPNIQPTCLLSVTE